MSRRFATSVAFVVALLAVAAAQDPDAKKPADPKQKKADPTEAAVAAALRNDTDVRIAQAKVQLAEAELAKAKQGVVLKVMTLKASIDDHRRAVEIAAERAAWTQRLVEKGQGTQQQMVDERAKLETAKAALSRAEMELKLLTGDAGAGTGAAFHDADWLRTHDSAAQLSLRWFAARQLLGEKLEFGEGDYATTRAWLALREATTVKGPIPDRIRAGLDTPVKLAEKNQYIQFQAAVEAFKKAGLDVPFRMKIVPEMLTSEGEEMPIGAWLQLFLDSTPGAVMVVREYGILVGKKGDVPPDAPTVMEFWKQKPPAAAKKEPAPEPKPK